eukprot:UN10963
MGWSGLLRLVFSLCGALAGGPAHNPQREKQPQPPLGLTALILSSFSSFHQQS